MATCTECGDGIGGMPFTCQRCGGRFCSTHRLPENHACGEHAVVAPEMSHSRWDAVLGLAIIGIVLVGLVGGAFLAVNAFGDDVASALDGAGEAVGIADDGDAWGEDEQMTLHESGVLGSDRLDAVVAHQNGTVDLQFAEDHQADGWSIIHAYDDNDGRYALFNGETPRFGGTVSIPLGERVVEGEYPTNEFEIVIMDGTFCGWDEFCISLYTETHETVTIEVPERWTEASGEVEPIRSS